MRDAMEIVEKLLENEHKGLIYINEEKNIGLYSSAAREIAGLVQKRERVHSAGTLRTGDIVIIADNELGDDDMLTPAHLEKINIHDPAIEMGDSVLAVGVFNNDKIVPQYKYLKGYHPSGRFELNVRYLGFEIGCAVDFGKNQCEIDIKGEKYVFNYFKSAGHMVIIDGINGKVKFYEDIGYGFRGEEIGRIFDGKAFCAKEAEEENKEIRQLVGEKAEKVLNGDKILAAIEKNFGREDGYTQKGIFWIYKRPMYCTLMRSKTGDKTDGVYIIVQDAERLESVREERNAITELLEQQQKRRFIDSVAEDGQEDVFDDFIGNDPAMWEVKRLAYKASKTKFNVIITGESGTGKSRLAREIHNLENKGAPFVEVNCNAIAPSLFESELFGYAPGAFTGASSGGRGGYFEAANGGTLFLDEIGDIPMDIQVKLLHVLQNKKIYRVGSFKPVHVDVRIITATNRNLEEAVAEGTFRQDLFYRINVFPINIPPLRERKGDLYVLINSVLKDICGRYGHDSLLLSEEALNKMMNYNWPGNVRELENVLERAVTICDSPIIYSEHILINSDELRGTSLRDRLLKEEKRIIEETLIKNNYNRKKTMEELEVSKSVFYQKLKTIRSME